MAAMFKSRWDILLPGSRAAFLFSSRAHLGAHDLAAPDNLSRFGAHVGDLPPNARVLAA
jgi:hypothetical protein